VQLQVRGGQEFLEDRKPACGTMCFVKEEDEK